MFLMMKSFHCGSQCLMPFILARLLTLCDIMFNDKKIENIIRGQEECKK
jgi:hypothetical protein